MLAPGYSRPGSRVHPLRRGMYSTGAAGLFSAGRGVLRAYLLTTLNGSSSDSGGDLPDGPLGGVLMLADGPVREPVSNSN